MCAGETITELMWAARRLADRERAEMIEKLQTWLEEDFQDQIELT